MNVVDSLGNTGRKMDAAWRQAISEGKLRANAGLKRVSDFTEKNVNKLKDATAQGLLNIVPNQKYRVKLLNVAAKASDAGNVVLGSAFTKGVAIGAPIGGALGGMFNKHVIANVNKLRPVGADQAKAVAAFKQAKRTGVLIENGRKIPIGAVQGAVHGLKLATKVIGAGTVLLTGAAAVMGAVDKENIDGKRLEKALQARVANKKIRERSSTRLKRQG
jgi:hypothetical protein